MTDMKMITPAVDAVSLTINTVHHTQLRRPRSALQILLLDPGDIIGGEIRPLPLSGTQKVARRETSGPSAQIGLRIEDARTKCPPLISVCIRIWFSQQRIDFP